MTASLEQARIPLQIDVGFGDAITPEPRKQTFDAILDLPAPTLKVYPQETVIAEKFEAMVTRGIANSRMKDFYDIWYLSTHFEFNGEIIQKAIQNTFARRGIKVPKDTPFALSTGFQNDLMKQTQWGAFLRRNGLGGRDLELKEIITQIKDFLLPAIQDRSQNSKPGKRWTPEKGWA